MERRMEERRGCGQRRIESRDTPLGQLTLAHIVLIIAERLHIGDHRRTCVDDALQQTVGARQLALRVHDGHAAGALAVGRDEHAVGRCVGADVGEVAGSRGVASLERVRAAVGSEEERRAKGGGAWVEGRGR